MGTTRDVATWLAERIAALPGYSFAGDGLPDSTGATTPVVLGFQPATPDRVLTVAVVPMGDDPSLPLGEVFVQVRARGRAGCLLDADDDLDAVFGVLHGAAGIQVGAWGVVQVLRANRAPLGVDGLDRPEAADHYDARIDYPPTDTRPDGGAW